MAIATAANLKLCLSSQYQGTQRIGQQVKGQDQDHGIEQCLLTKESDRYRIADKGLFEKINE